MTAKNQTLVKP